MTSHPQVLAVNSLQPSIDEFGIEPVVVSDEKIAHYLSSTEVSGLSTTDRLIALATALSQKTFRDGWFGLSKILEAAKNQDPENAGIVSMWVFLGLEVWMSETRTPDINNRSRIAEDVEALLEEGWRKNQASDWYPYMLGLLSFRSPQRETQNEKCLEKALGWLQIGLNMDSRNKCKIELQLARCCYELQDWSAAISHFESIDLNLLPKSEREGAEREIDDRIKQCRKRLEQQ